MSSNSRTGTRTIATLLMASLGGCVEGGEESTAWEETPVESRALSPDSAETHNRFEGRARVAALAEVERLKGIQSRYSDAIMGLPGVFALGIGHDDETKRFVFTVLVEDDAAVPDLPSHLEDVPVLVQRGERPMAHDGGTSCMTAPNFACHSNQLSLPVQTGNSGFPVDAGTLCSACTMGFKACDPGTGEAVFVTAAHCAQDGSTCPASASLGSPVFHTSPLDTASCTTASNVGSLLAQMPPFPGGTLDAAIVDSDASQTQISVRDIGVPDTTTGTPLIGDVVRKSGRTSGLTSGMVLLTNVSVAIGYNCAPSTGIILGQQILIWSANGSLACTGGDSGAGWFNDSDQIVGLHVAGNTSGTQCFANEASNVLGFFGLTMDFTDCQTEVCPAIDLTQNSPGGDQRRRHLYQLRDEVLGQTEFGKDWIRRFYQVAPAWVGLYATHPNLFRRTQASLEANAGVLSAVASRKKVTVERAQVRSLVELIDDHITASDDEDLDAAFTLWRSELLEPDVQAMFLVTIR